MEESEYMWGIGVVIAKCQTDLLSENVKKSLKRKVEVHGEWYGPAPLGYLNKRDEKGRGDIIKDPIAGSAIKKIFEEYASGAYTLSYMVRRSHELGLVSKNGLDITKSTLYHILQNPFYYGQMRIKGELWPHRYETLISRETYKACEAVRMGWNKKPFQYRSKEFLFSGILKCAVTGKVVVSDTKTKTYKDGTKGEWTYLRTWDPENPDKMIWVREDKVIAQIEESLKNLKIKNPEILKKTMEYLSEVNKGKAHEFNREVAALKQEHTNIQNKLDSLLDLVTEGVVTREEFASKKAKLKDRQYDLTEFIKSYDKTDDKFSKKLIDLINITTNAYETFKGSTIAENREFLNFIYSNLELKGSKLLYAYRFPFDHMEKVANCTTWLPG